MSIGFTFDASELDDAITLMGPIFSFSPAEMMEGLASLGESQTRRRITSEKTAPDGAPWAPNVEGTSILHQTGNNLLDSVASFASEGEATWGASWQYAHVHQDGMTIVPKNADKLFFNIGGKTVAAKQVTIPARPFVGLSSDNREEMLDLVTDVFRLGGS